MTGCVSACSWRHNLAPTERLQTAEAGSLVLQATRAASAEGRSQGVSWPVLPRQAASWRSRRHSFPCSHISVVSSGCPQGLSSACPSDCPQAPTYSDTWLPLRTGSRILHSHLLLNPSVESRPWRLPLWAAFTGCRDKRLMRGRPPSHPPTPAMQPMQGAQPIWA